jgi:hypothetical protein
MIFSSSNVLTEACLIKLDLKLKQIVNILKKTILGYSITNKRFHSTFGLNQPYSFEDKCYAK